MMAKMFSQFVDNVVFCMMSSILSELIMFNIDKFTFALDNKLNFEQGCLVLGTQ